MIIIVFLSALLVGCSQSDSNGKDDSPKKYNGYVPDASTAKKIAEAIWLPIYAKAVLDEKPYKARIVGDSVWIVEGTLGQGMTGGTAYIEISVKTGTILKVTHYR